jgi:hypothetical protein
MIVELQQHDVRCCASSFVEFSLVVSTEGCQARTMSQEIKIGINGFGRIGRLVTRGRAVLCFALGR